VVDSTFIKELGGYHPLDNLLHDLFPELLRRDLFGVLSGDNDRVNTEGDDGSAVLLILDGDLGLRVRPEPGHLPRATRNGHRSIELVRQHDRERHVLLRLVCGVAEHDALVAGAKRLERAVVEALSNIGRLLLDGNEEVARLVVEALRRVVVADVPDGLAHDLLVVEFGLGGDFAQDHDHARFSGGLASDLGERVFGEAGIELHAELARAVVRELNTDDSVGDLITDLV
jgi:hypothetical protein